MIGEQVSLLPTSDQRRLLNTVLYYIIPKQLTLFILCLTLVIWLCFVSFLIRRQRTKNNLTICLITMIRVL